MGLSCEVHFDNRCGIYQPGQMISGRVTLTLQERALIKALALKISGFAATRWEKPVKPKKAPKPKPASNAEQDAVPALAEVPKEYYTNREDYISTLNYFIGSEAAIPNIIESGVYNYTFSTRLPDNCMSSFESAFGHIRYELNVFIDYPEHRHFCYARTLTVRRPNDLHTDLLTPAQPNEIQMTEKISFFKFWQHPLLLNLNTPKHGYLPGETISLHVQILNSSKLTMNELNCRLNMVGTYAGIHKRKQKVPTETVQRIMLQQSMHSLFGQNGTLMQHLQELVVPETPPSMENAACKCIQIAYEVEVCVTTSNPKRLLCVQLPIKIGAIPCRAVPLASDLDYSSTLGLRPTSSIEVLDALPTAGYIAASAPPHTPEPIRDVSSGLSASMNSLTSSFKEADFMTAANLNKSNKHTMSGEKVNFKPKYVFYEMENGDQATLAAGAGQIIPAATASTNQTRNLYPDIEKC